MTVGIYKIRNIANGKCYVGSAINIEKRWGEHRCSLGLGNHHSIKLQRAWEKHGASSFEFLIAEVVVDSVLLLSREQAWLDESRSATVSGYNVQPTAGSNLGRKFGPETRAKISLAKRNPSDETRARLAAARIGCKATDQARRNQSLAMMGHDLSVETRAKIGAAHKGLKKKPLSAEHKAKLSAMMLGKKWSAEGIAQRWVTRRAQGVQQ